MVNIMTYSRSLTIPLQVYKVSLMSFVDVPY